MRLAATTLFAMLATLLSATPVLAESKPRKSVEIGDIDTGTSPCTDFFQFANGKWRAENPIPASQPRWSRRWEAGETSKGKLRGILEAAASTKAAKGSDDQLIGDFYAGCMDEAQAEKAGAKPIEPLLKEIDGLRDAKDVQRMISKLHGMQIAVPFDLYGESDVHEPSNVIGHLYAAGLGMPDRDYYLKQDDRFKETREKYRTYVTRLFELSGSPQKDAVAAADAVLQMETAFAKHSFDKVTLRNPKAIDHVMSPAELQKLTPAFDWKAYFDGQRVRTGTAVNVAEPDFMKEIDRQLRETPLPQWKTYLQWHVLNSAAPSLSKAFVEEEFAFNGAYLNGAREMKPRWKRCAEATDKLLGDPLGRKYVEKYFPPEAKARMQELVANLRLAMKETIDGLEWMSAETKKKALEKLATFNPKVGYPDKWRDFSGIPVARHAYWDSVVAARQFNVQDNLALIGKPVDRGRWLLTPPTSDAYYNPTLNEIVFPAGILQPPAFSVNNVDAVNYGAIGVVIGHEISHGFDDQGAQFDAHGRLENWWTDADLKKFQARGECVVKQFEGYFVEPGIHHNGKLVLGESIGDLAGAKIAYRAFQISQRGKPKAPTIDGYTPDQQFFIAWGQFRGDEVRPEFARKMVQGDPHPIAKYRVIGPLSNLPEFAEAFSCPKDAPMVRKESERCEVW
jgi:endothelin-converting enzyme/putative endopeptidase